MVQIFQEGKKKGHIMYYFIPRNCRPFRWDCLSIPRIDFKIVFLDNNSLRLYLAYSDYNHTNQQLLSVKLFFRKNLIEILLK